MQPAVEPLYATLDLNTRLFQNALNGVDDGVAQERPGDANNIAFLTLHLIDARYFLARMLGLEEAESPFADITQDVNSVEELGEIPSLAELMFAWQEVSGLLEERLQQISAEELLADSPHKFPVIGREDVLGALAFMLAHESQHIGQIALLRRVHGLAAMQWT
ncbi:MAG TPA: DinB family protein [Acidobacteriota bacterium]|nr:DinB family protein [Acidobacteriota bacterium]